MVAVDDATVDNGCLEVVSGMHHEVLPMDDVGCMHPDVVAQRCPGQPVEVRRRVDPLVPLPHPAPQRPQHVAVPRRALYPTYNARSRATCADYYREKLARFAAEGARADGKVKVSLIDDFQGEAV
jgi:hypothetical protein